MNILILLWMTFSYYPSDYPLNHPTNFSLEHNPSTIEVSLSSLDAVYSLYSEKKERDKITQFAKKLKGTNYKYGGYGRNGFDCSGLTFYVFSHFGIKMERSSGSQARQGKKKSLKNLEPADLLFFGNKGEVNHVGIVLKVTKDELFMIHSSSSKGVIIENVYLSSYWKNRLLFAKEILNF